MKICFNVRPKLMLQLAVNAMNADVLISGVCEVKCTLIFLKLYNTANLRCDCAIVQIESFQNFSKISTELDFNQSRDC
ncbi:hypothetical protein OUZ56_028780 [Daphnia magna]|uniref:Secreted protein n=1 Tax=Daphnia magna TaxID=35525 RepID=A0ABR0B4Y3_9CRUS|nr:hypothetical protein OUZ56_028780 [Daphnia magna]